MDNRLEGRDGEDTFYGLGGDDELVGGKDSDLYIFEDGFGIDLVVELAGGGADDVLDFTAVTAPLTFTIGTQIHVTDGVNEVTHAGLNVETVLGGSQSERYANQRRRRQHLDHLRAGHRHAERRRLLGHRES